MTTKHEWDISRRRLLQAAGAAALSAPFIGRPVWAQGKPVKIGVILPTSGVLAAPGQASLRGVELGAKLLSEKAGMPVEFVYADTESVPENGRVAAERLIQDGCTLLIGAWDTGATISAAQAAEQAKVPILVNIASAPQITEQGFTQLFRNFPPATTLVYNAVARIKDLFAHTGVQPKTAVLLHVNDTFGKGVTGGINALWDKLDVPIEIVDQISYDLRARDLSVEVAKAKATGADLLMPVTRVNDAILIVREMVRQNYNPMGIIGPGSPGPYEKAFTDATGKYGDQYMVSVPWYDPTRDLTKQTIASFNKEYPNERFELNVGFSYEAVEIAVDALSRAQSGEPAAIHDALKTTDLKDHVMYGGPIVFNEKGQNPNIGGVMLQNQDSEPLVIGPQEIAVAEPIFPMTPFQDR
ncbi:ABC transporter substrate-binding protein [Amorphus orientalis]|uniref:Branched-chain amino acid transport system substrate-binding protein n=1 Tax=Amorphus orientalis TaxID=649198 RepID=A0AAE4ARR0_9HYPH|nr:ABC transporter substrate-binding protein [Amorphus orientalis]MDQ0314457.1 branched-chain amino acid transport system substrate-binding protein [Amorphus orientalis]